MEKVPMADMAMEARIAVGHGMEMLNEYPARTRSLSAGARGRILVVEDGNKLGGKELSKWNERLASVHFSPRARSAA